MSLIRIEYGSVASSSDMNNNFNYLEGLIEDLGATITDKTSGFSSTVQTLNQSVQDLLTYRANFISVGMVLPYLGSDAPAGYLLCDGSEVLVEDFEDLYNVIGDLYESSDSTLFKLPDLTNKTLWGNDYGLILGSILDSALPNIKGQFRLAGTEGSSSVSGAFSAGSKGGSYGTGHNASASNPLMKFDASKSSSIYKDSCSIVQPPALVVNYIIKY